MRKLLSGLNFSHQQAKASNRPEFEQSMIRVVVAVFLFSYYLIFNYTGDAGGDQQMDLIIELAIAYGLSSLLLHSVVLINLQKPWVHYRRISGMLMDNGFLTAALITTGEIAVPLFAIYLWVAFGNGFRFGIPYLVGSAILALCGFIAVYLLSSFWQTNFPMWISMLISLVILPPYIAVLLYREQKAKQRAEKANKAKSEFLAQVTHELRTPLNAIIGLSELLISLKLKREAANYAGRILDSGQHLLKTINDILDTSKLESDGLTLEEAPFDLHHIVNSCVESFRLEARKKNLSLIVHFDLNLQYQLIGDPHRVRQILTNILGNAIKFTESGYIHIKIQCRKNDGQRQQVSFLIADTGIGMDRATIDRIFKPFAQGDVSTTRKYGGTGLGVSISKRLIDQMEGTLSVKSTLNKGSVFKINLPFTLDGQDQQNNKLADTYWLVFSPNPIGSNLQTRFEQWGLSYRLESDLPRVTQFLREQRTEDQRIDGALMINPDQFDQHALKALLRQFTDMDYASPASLIEIAEKPTIKRFHEFERYYLFNPQNPINYVHLFNAIHSSALSNSDTDNAVEQHHSKPIYQNLAILVAEDHETNATVLRAMLNNVGLHPTIVSDGEQLLQQLKTQKWDLIISDLCMPKIDGIDAFQIYQAETSPDDIPPFILLTANIDETTRERVAQVGIKHYLTKPIKSAALFDCIANTLERKAMPHSPTHSPQSEKTPVENQNKLVDTKAIESAFNLNASKAYQDNLYNSYVQDTRERLTGMQLAITEDNLQDFTHHAHALKGSSAYLGLIQMQTLADQSQHIDPSLWPDTARKAMQAFQTAWPATLQALDAYVASRNNLVSDSTTVR